jgi:hypothetical protein
MAANVHAMFLDSVAETRVVFGRTGGVVSMGRGALSVMGRTPLADWQAAEP